MERRLSWVRPWRQTVRVLAMLGCMKLGASSEFYQANIPEISYTTEEAESLIELEIPEPVAKLWEEWIPNTKLEVPNEKVEDISGYQVDLRPPALLLRFIGDLEFLERDTLPHPEQSGRVLYIGFPVEEQYRPQILWNKVCRALRHEGVQLVSFPAPGKYKLQTSWYVWSPHDHNLSAQTCYEISLVKLQGKRRNYLKLVLQDAFKEVPLYREPVGDQEPPFSLPRYTQERYLRSMANKIMLAMEKQRRVVQYQFLLEKHPRLSLRIEDDGIHSRRFIIDAPFALVWKVLPELLKKTFVTVTKSDLRCADMLCEYFPPADVRLSPQQKQQDMRLVDLMPGQYKLQFFDFGEYTSLQWCHFESGEVLDETFEIWYDVLHELLDRYKESLKL